MRVERGERLMVTAYVSNAFHRSWRPGSIVYAEGGSEGTVYARNNPHGLAMAFADWYLRRIEDRPSTRHRILVQMAIGDERRKAKQAGGQGRYDD